MMIILKEIYTMKINLQILSVQEGWVMGNGYPPKRNSFFVQNKSDSTNASSDNFRNTVTSLAEKGP